MSGRRLTGEETIRVLERVQVRGPGGFLIWVEREVEQTRLVTIGDVRKAAPMNHRRTGHLRRAAEQQVMGAIMRDFSYTDSVAQLCPANGHADKPLPWRDPNPGVVQHPPIPHTNWKSDKPAVKRGQGATASELGWTTWIEANR